MRAEFDALMANGTWTLCPRPTHKIVIRNKWVIKLKLKPDDTIDRYKARLVTKGFDELDGLNYTEISSSVIKPTTIQLLRALAVKFDWPIRQLDVSNAFLHGFLDEKVFIEQLQGFVDQSKPTFVC